MSGRFGPRRNYVVLGEYKPEEVFPYITVEETRKDYIGNDGNTYSVRMNSDRYYTFNRNPYCACCGILGVTLLLETHHKQLEKHPHFNFYAIDNGEHILLTKDHIVALANGGPNTRSNLQTLCTICNNLKGRDPLTLDELRIRKARFDMLELRGIKGLARTKWLGLYELEYGHKGKISHWTFVSRKTKEQIEDELRGQPIKADAVVIAAIANGKLVVTKEFRPIIGDYEWGLPAGLINKDEDVETAARRELYEETGLKLTNIMKISPILYSSAGCSNECVQIIHAQAEGKISAEHCEADEDIQTFLMSPQEVDTLISSEVKLAAKAWGIFTHFAGTKEINGG